jgi:hypothetical protein
MNAAARAPGVPSVRIGPHPDDATLAVVVARLDDLRAQQRADTQALTESIEALRRLVTESRSEMVSRDTWEARNAHVDDRFHDQGREIGELRATHAADVAALRQELASRRLPWPSVAAAITGIAALALTLAQLVP